MQFISLKASCCLPHLNGVTGAVSCTGDVLVSRSTRAGGWAYLGDLFHNCRPCRSVLSIPFGITLGSHQCTQMEKIETVVCIFGGLAGLFVGNGNGKVWWSIGRKSGVDVKALSCTDMEGRCLWMTVWGVKPECRCEFDEQFVEGKCFSFCVFMLWSLWIERRRHNDVEDFKYQNLCSMDTWSPNHENQLLNVRICLAGSDQRPQLITVGAALISLILKLHV